MQVVSGRPAARSRGTRKPIQNSAPDEVLQAKVKAARQALAKRGVLSGAQTRRLSARVDPGLLEEAKRRSGAQSDSEVVSAALALMASDDNFGAWLVSRKGRLPDDFELPI